MIIKVEKSDRKDKKYKAILDDGKIIHFGLDGSNTYTDGASKEKRDNYLKRHLGNKTEKHLIENLIISPALLSAYLLWNTNNLDENIKILNKMLSKKPNLN
jgi:hypothetical protein